MTKTLFSAKVKYRTFYSIPSLARFITTQPSLSSANLEVSVLREKLDPTPVKPGDESWADLMSSEVKPAGSAQVVATPLLQPLASRAPKSTSVPALKGPTPSQSGEKTPSSPPPEPAPYSEPDLTPASGAVAMGTTRTSAPPDEVSKPAPSATTTMRWSLPDIQKAAAGLPDPKKSSSKGPSKTLVGMPPIKKPEGKDASVKAPAAVSKSLPKPATAPDPAKRPPPLPKPAPVGSYQVVPEREQAVEEIPSLDPLPDPVPPPLPAREPSPLPELTQTEPVALATSPLKAPALAVVLSAEPMQALALQSAPPAPAMASPTVSVPPPVAIRPLPKPWQLPSWFPGWLCSFFLWLWPRRFRR